MVVSSIFFMFTPNFGEDEPNWTVAYFSDGLVKNHQADFGCPEPDFQGGHCHCHGNLAGERPESASLLREPHVWKHPKHLDRTFTSPKKLAWNSKKWWFLDVSPFSKQVFSGSMLVFLGV